MRSGLGQPSPETNINPDLFAQQRSPRFGTANPERMQLAFWEWMIRAGEERYRIRGLFNVPSGRGVLLTFSLKDYK